MNKIYFTNKRGSIDDYLWGRREIAHSHMWITYSLARYNSFSILGIINITKDELT